MFSSARLMSLTAPRNVAYPSALERLLHVGHHFLGGQGYSSRVAASVFPIESVLYVQQARFHFASEYCDVCLGAVVVGEPASIASPIRDWSVFLLRVT